MSTQTQTITVSRIYKRKLSEHQGTTCAAAKGPICRCRCKGLLHGLDHNPYRQAELRLFEERKAQQQPVTTADIVALAQRIKEIITHAATTTDNPIQAST